MLHINQFIDRLKAAESRHQRDFQMTIMDARNLHADITKLLVALNTLADNKSANQPQSSIQDIEVQGGSF